jgi:hypothetical protein
MRADAPRGQWSPVNVMGSTTIQILIAAMIMVIGLRPKRSGPLDIQDGSSKKA